MRAITLIQPWASLWLSPAKVHETSSWSTLVRGTVAVYAGQRFIKTGLSDDLTDILDIEFGPHWRRDLPVGALIGTLDLIDYMPAARPPIERFDNNAASASDYVCGNWSPGRFAWRRGAFARFERPVPFKGRQGWFHVDDKLLKEAA